MINKVILLGRLGKEPEVRAFEGGNKVCNFSLATTKVFKDQQGQKFEKTEWHNCSIWSNGLIGIVEKYVSKGSLIYVEGELATRSWTDQKGEKKYSTEIIINILKMLSGTKKETQSQQNNEYNNVNEENFPTKEEDDDFPF